MNYHDIKIDNMLNGEGLRIVLFLSGCAHNCKGCHNPQTHNPDSGEMFTSKEVEVILEWLGSNYISGLTISGGDPLYSKNTQGVLDLIEKVREKYGEGKTIWLYTGYTWDQIFDENVKDCDGQLRQKIICKCDVVVDGRYVEELKDINYPYAGSTNQRVIKIAEKLIHKTQNKY